MKILAWLMGKVLHIVTVLSTVIFYILNFENLTNSFYGAEPTKSLNVRYQYWLEDIYGERRGVEIYREFRDFTIWMVNHHINEMLFFAIVLMMIVSIVFDRKVNKKENRRLVVYYVVCFIIMWFATFLAGPYYVDYWYGL